MIYQLTVATFLLLFTFENTIKPSTCDLCRLHDYSYCRLLLSYLKCSEVKNVPLIKNKNSASFKCGSFPIRNHLNIQLLDVFPRMPQDVTVKLRVDSLTPGDRFTVQSQDCWGGK